MFRYLRLLITFCFAVFFMAFAASNRDVISISLFPLPYLAETPVFILAIACFAIGIFIAGFAFLGRSARMHTKYRNEHKKNMALENELEGLKAERDNITSVITYSE